MNTSALASYRELENVDLLRDLDARSLHVTADGFSWHDVRPSSLPVSRLVGLYYYMALTREVDREIVKMLRKGLALGKHLMCTGHEAIAVGACAAMRPGEWVAPSARDLGAFQLRLWLTLPVPVSSRSTPRFSSSRRRILRFRFSPVLEAAHLPITGKLVKALRELLAY